MKSIRFVDAALPRGASVTDFSWNISVSELKEQRRMAQRDGDYEKWVLLLKESDERTRLEAFVAMLIGKLDCNSLSANDHDWVAEHKRLLSIFYRHPDLPKECQANGALTGAIRTLVVSHLKAEQEGVENEIKETEATKGGSISQYFFRLCGTIRG